MVRVKNSRRKIPAKAVDLLLFTSQYLSGHWEKPAAEIFKYFLGLMKRYSDYFFSEPWPAEFDIKKSTTFTDEDLEFLNENTDEFYDRYTTMLLKKNMALKEGFLGPFGMLWTDQAYNERFIRPGYEPVWEFFGSLAKEGEDGRSVLNKLKEKFDVDFIHDSLVDLYAIDCPHVVSYIMRRLIDEMLTLLHTVEGVPNCKEWDCTWYRNQKYGTPSSGSDKTLESRPLLNLRIKTGAVNLKKSYSGKPDWC